MMPRILSLIVLFQFLYAGAEIATPRELYFQGFCLNNSSSKVMMTDSVRISPSSSDFNLKFKTRNLSKRPYGFFLSTTSGRIFTTIETVEPENIISSKTAVKISFYIERDSIPLKSVTLSDGIGPFKSHNIWELHLSDGLLSLSGSDKSIIQIMSVNLKEADCQCRAFGFAAAPGAILEVTDISFAESDHLRLNRPGKWADTALLREYLISSDDPMEGYWTIFDRSLDESLLKLGGDYRLAIVKSGVNYHILYLGGAKVNASGWLPGMKKGELRPDPFPGIYSLTWIDSEGKPLDIDVKAQSGDGDTLEIQFPYQDSSIRLRKLPASGGTPASR